MLSPSIRSLLAGACALLLTAFAPGPADPPGAAPAPDLSGYVGSDACRKCHEEDYADWKASLHSHMEQPATPQTVIAPFSSETPGVPTTKDMELKTFREGDRFYVLAPNADGKPERYLVDRTVGNRHKQRYLTKLPDGSWHPLPIQWNARDGQFVEWGNKASSPEGEGGFWLDPGWQWQLKCAGCHTTGLDLGYDPQARTYDTHWNELAIGCEACHGPGRAHVEAKGGKDNILCPSDFTLQRQLDACGKCHSRGSAGPEQGAPANLPGRLSYPINMLPGSELDTVYEQVTPETEAHDFWPDGSSKNHHQQLTSFRKSMMLHKGQDDAPSCTDCHEPHKAAALTDTTDDNRLCIRCHKALRGSDALAGHTHHGGDPLANAGARCVECHMPRIVNHAGSDKLRSHTFWPPDPAQAATLDMPDPCLLCHTDEDREWSQASMAEMYPDLDQAGDR